MVRYLTRKLDGLYALGIIELGQLQLNRLRAFWADLYS
jgi:hypothetical protein